MDDIPSPLISPTISASTHSTVDIALLRPWARAPSPPPVQSLARTNAPTLVDRYYDMASTTSTDSTATIPRYTIPPAAPLASRKFDPFRTYEMTVKDYAHRSAEVFATSIVDATSGFSEGIMFSRDVNAAFINTVWNATVAELLRCFSERFEPYEIMTTECVLVYEEVAQNIHDDLRFLEEWSWKLFESKRLWKCRDAKSTGTFLEAVIDAYQGLYTYATQAMLVWGVRPELCLRSKAMVGNV